MDNERCTFFHDTNKTPANQLLFNPWQRSGFPPLRIDE